MLRFTLVAGALILIVVGAFVALTGSAFGSAIAAFGVIDLLTVPLVVRMIERSQRKIELEVAAQRTARQEPAPAGRPGRALGDGTRRARGRPHRTSRWAAPGRCDFIA